MKKKWTMMMAVVISALMMLTAVAEVAPEAAVPELNYTERVFYAGEGIFKIEFMRDVAWRSEYVLTVKDDQDTPLTASVLGGDAKEVYVQLDSPIIKDARYTFGFVSDRGVIYAIGQSTEGFSCPNYCEYCLEFGHDEMACPTRQANGIYYDVDRCDLCGALNHDEDACPERMSDRLYCDECASYGHDDDFCPYDAEDDDRYERCDFCGTVGHDDDYCPNRNTSSAAASSFVNTPSVRTQYCDECGKTGHDDDHCPNERCDECGKTGHDDDHCPNERCDECGKTGHDDDHCPYERCDECGKTGHDDDHCPYD